MHGAFVGMQAWYWISCRLGPLNREPSSKVRASWAKEMRWRDRRQRCCESRGEGEKVEARRESQKTIFEGRQHLKKQQRSVGNQAWQSRDRSAIRKQGKIYQWRFASKGSCLWTILGTCVRPNGGCSFWLQISVALVEEKFLPSLPIKAFSESIEHFIRKFLGQPVAFWIERAHAALRFVTLKAKPQSRERNRSNEIGHLRYQQKASSATKSVPDLGQLQRTVMNTCTCAFVHVSSEHEFWTRTNMSDLWSG